MFLSGEDFYFITYAILVFLHALGCKNGRFFRDSKKLSLLIPFITDSALIGILERAKGCPIKNPVDAEFLLDAFMNGVIREPEVIKLLAVLEKRKIVSLGQMGPEINVSMNSDELPEEFFKNEGFKTEFDNSIRIKKIIPRLSTLTKDSLIYRLYDEHGIKRWQI
jgi:hypothetical protein